MKLTKEDIDKVRHIEGFPIAEDEDIIAISNPPYYTACPNPFIEDFIKEHGTPYDEETDDYHREPFAADVSEGKSDPLYNAHTYHTKVPYKAIMRYILHYTNPGDIVFDGFCGTGMTGVAAQMCGHSDNEFRYIIEKEMPDVKWGERKAILNDLSPASTFIAQNYNSPVDVDEFVKISKQIVDDCEKELGWMYETTHVDDNKNKVTNIDGNLIKGKINYTVWSDVFICPQCGVEIIYWDVAVSDNKVSKHFSCTNCGIQLTKNACKRAEELYIDKKTSKQISISKQRPVLINYIVNKKQYLKTPDKEDLKKIEEINNISDYNWYPQEYLPNGCNTEQPKRSHGVIMSDLFYTRRNLCILSKLNYLFGNSKYKIVLQSVNASLCSKLSRYNLGKRGNGPLTGTLYIASLIAESNVFKLVKGKIKDFTKAYGKTKSFSSNIIQCSSLSEVPIIQNNSMDYIFTDPPFGANLNYSELSFLWETWLKVRTNNISEAIINNVQGKSLLEYQALMCQCFQECYRVLKPNRWMTVEFHNSQNSVWNAIQESLNRAGFIVADVRTLDKKQGSFKQVTTTSATKQDLIISAYKPKDSFRKTILEHAGTKQTAWDFVREHLDKLPIVVRKGDRIETVREREAFLLFDRMVAYHVITGIAVPLDASEFYRGLDDKFLKRDNMYFLHDQINKYDDARIKSEIEPIQFSLYVSDERSAIAWLYQQLDEQTGGPQTYGEIQPKFVQELRQDKHEKLPELMTMLEENFLQDEEGKWYVPDITKEGDLMKLREKRLLKDFEEYLTGKGKLKSFRTEAVRAGFAKLWKDKSYKDIVKVAERLPEKVIQEDDKLLMYYDISLGRLE